VWHPCSEPLHKRGADPHALRPASGSSTTQGATGRSAPLGMVERLTAVLGVVRGQPDTRPGEGWIGRSCDAVSRVIRRRSRASSGAARRCYAVRRRAQTAVLKESTRSVAWAGAELAPTLPDAAGAQHPARHRCVTQSERSIRQGTPRRRRQLNPCGGSACTLTRVSNAGAACRADAAAGGPHHAPPSLEAGSSAPLRVAVAAAAALAGVIPGSLRGVYRAARECPL
jgi:hypothetical protein